MPLQGDGIISCTFTAYFVGQSYFFHQFCCYKYDFMFSINKCFRLLAKCHCVYCCFSHLLFLQKYYYLLFSLTLTVHIDKLRKVKVQTGTRLEVQNIMYFCCRVENRMEHLTTFILGRRLHFWGPDFSLISLFCHHGTK